MSCGLLCALVCVWCWLCVYLLCTWVFSEEVCWCVLRLLCWWCSMWSVDDVKGVRTCGKLKGLYKNR